jgi:CRISPR/Cas system-associated exonuclease Cas4 (RecB family)
VRIDLFDGRIVLQGRVDLTLGHARGTTARKVLIDLKTGGFAPGHAEDLRFYALLETLRIGTPPIRLATYYLDSGRPHAERVTLDTLHSAVRRTVDGAVRLAGLIDHGQPPVRRPGPSCRWCPLQDGCPDGSAVIHLDGLR